MPAFRFVGRPVPCLAALAVACALAAPPTAWADSITLHNGDRLTGRVLHMSPSTLVFETTWAGELRIPRYEIRAIETDKPVRVLRERSKHTESMTLGPAAPGQVALTPEVSSPSGGVDGAGWAQPDVPVPTGPESPAAQPQPAITIPLVRVRYLEPRPEESGEGASYEGRVTLAGTFVRGNSTGDRAYAEGDFEARARDWRYASTAKLNRERGDAATTASNWLVGGNLDRFLDDRRFGYLRGSVERDRFRDISVRATAGAGLGVQLVQTGRTKLSLRGGLDAIEVHRIAGSDESWPALGWGANLGYRLDAWPAELFHDQQGFLNLDDPSQVTLRSRTGLRVPFASGLTASLQFNFDWDSQPSPGRRSGDATWLVGLGYAW
ncbi:MAG: DUF481 domain-containing protein [Burkholderiaceae bacterium]|nr:DUF481 domain-containing protein [Burkholderiaceae bacterium]MEB2352724.1 DUF481 domain-containing protein [Burkholderiaceae bacterium]